jgi:cell division protein FtsZ
MSLSFDLNYELKPKIVVFGVGGAGGNAVNNMINSGLDGVDFWVANTDAQALNKSLAPNKIQLGVSSTMGLGAGSNPDIGCKAAQESIEQIESALEGSHMVFITAGMGGGTGTGAAPIIANIAKQKGILTVAVVTKPFHFEGARRMKISEIGLDALAENIDTIIIIPNQNLFHVANEKTTFADAFIMADKILDQGVRSITELITTPGAINLDFADIRTVMSEMGRAMMSTGEAEGENRAIKAAEAAISNPLLDSASMRGAKGVLINITGSGSMTLYEVDEAANRIREEADPNAQIIFGTAFDQDLGDKIRVSVVATGIDNDRHVQSVHQHHIHTNTTTTIKTQTPEPKRVEKPILNMDTIQDVNRPEAFVPPQPQQVDEHRDIFSRPIATEELQQEVQQSQNTTEEAKSLFSRVNSNFSRMSNVNTIDIPAILRRNNSEENK